MAQGELPMEPARDSGAQPDRTADPVAASAGSAAESSSGLTPEDIAYMQTVQKKRLIVMVVAGLVLMVLGFLAGKHIAGGRSDSAPPVASAVVVEESAMGEEWSGADEARIVAAPQEGWTVVGSDEARIVVGSDGQVDIDEVNA